MIRRIRGYIMDTLGFSKTEANGILILIMIIFLFAVIPRIYLLQTQKDQEKFTGDPEKLRRWAASLDSAFSTDEKKELEETTPSPPVRIQNFPFDPNKATDQELAKLGFSKQVIANLIKYRESGGYFSDLTDLKKIYGISYDRVHELESFIQFPSSPTKDEHTQKSIAEKSVIKPLEIELNTAEVADFQAVPGIGPVLSKRIVSFRENLGGFHDPNQLYEVYGLDSTVVQKLLSRTTLKASLSKININTDSINHLYQHPYLDYNIAKTIINYRKQHGPFESVEQVKKIKIISDSLYQKIYPYLSIDL